MLHASRRIGLGGSGRLDLPAAPTRQQHPLLPTRTALHSTAGPSLGPTSPSATPSPYSAPSSAGSPSGGSTNAWMTEAASSSSGSDRSNTGFAGNAPGGGAGSTGFAGSGGTTRSVAGGGGPSFGRDSTMGGYWELLSSQQQEVLGQQRARSASDAAVLRRKGHLKEQDRLIDYMRKMHETHTCEEVMLKMERWMAEHRADPRRSRLKRLVPNLGIFFMPLKLVEAFREYDAFFALSRRKYIPPNFAELRHIVNIGQVHASADGLRLITFDADGTLYADGAHLEQDNAMIALIVNLLRSNIQVAIVTAAGYPDEAHKFERRVEGLLEAFQRLRLPQEITSKFLIMGGECNYLLRVRHEDQRLVFVPDADWKTDTMLAWDERDITAMLDEAEGILVEGAKRLNLPVTVIRKGRAVGIVPAVPTIYEVLEDIALTVQTQLVAKAIPFCAFNGGNDVFVDVGNKSLGLQALMKYVQVHPHETLHVGDRFTDSGNDVATRDICSVLWVANPQETGFFIKMLIRDIRKSRWQPYIE